MRTTPIQDKAARAICGGILADDRALADRGALISGFVPEFLQLISSENIADLEIRIRARLAYTLVEPANVAYSSKGFLIQLSGIRQSFEFSAVNLAAHQFMIRK
jgi:hypothetical protein